MFGYKKWRRKIGLFYWEWNGKTKTWWYFRKKNWNRFFNWIKGWSASVKANPDAIKNAQCLVVCAHPDDETLYFSSVLKELHPFVICMSNAGSRERVAELNMALEAQNVSGMVLNMPDVPYMAWLWDVLAPRRLQAVAHQCTNVKTVYTHSLSGESHHPHHYATGRAVDKVFAGCKIIKTAEQVPLNGRGRLSDEDRERKLMLLRKCYPSQIKMLEGWYPWWMDYLENEFFGES